MTDYTEAPFRSGIAHYCALIKSRATLAKKRPVRVDKPRVKKTARGRSITAMEVLEAKRFALKGWTNEQLAKRFSVSIGQIQKHCRDIKRGHRDGR
jgi:hypothetical protein